MPAASTTSMDVFHHKMYSSVIQSKATQEINDPITFLGHIAKAQIIKASAIRICLVSNGDSPELVNTNQVTSSNAKVARNLNKPLDLPSPDMVTSD